MTTTFDKPMAISEFYENAKFVANEGIEAVKTKYSELEAKHPQTLSLAKKVAPFAIALFSFLCNPLSTVIGLTCGFVFAAQLKPMMSKIKECVVEAFKDMNVPGKILMTVTGIGLVFLLPGFVSSFAVGAYSGTHARTHLSLN